MNGELSLARIPEGQKMQVDWRVPIAVIVINIIGIAVQWGIVSAKIDELFHDKEQQEKHLEFIDDELRKRVAEAGEAKGFHDETLRRFDSVDKQLASIKQTHQ